jgi:uncharacterized protein (DUF488 family)
MLSSPILVLEFYMIKRSKPVVAGVSLVAGGESHKAVFTAGYEGTNGQSFVQSLQANAINTVVDVRQRAASRNRDFAKTRLASLVTAVGISYVHLPTLGTPAELRTQFRSSELSLESYLQRYRQYLAQQEAVVADLERRIEIERCCLLCVEADPAICHRTVLANYLVERSSGQLSVHNILTKEA